MSYCKVLLQHLLRGSDKNCRYLSQNTETQAEFWRWNWWMRNTHLVDKYYSQPLSVCSLFRAIAPQKRVHYTCYFISWEPVDGSIQFETCSHGGNTSCVWLRICHLPLIEQKFCSMYMPRECNVLYYLQCRGIGSMGCCWFSVSVMLWILT